MPRKSLSYPQWVKLGDINEFTFVGKDTVAVGCGCHILFCSVDGNVDSVYIANSHERGDGVACIAGHRTAPIFAFAEKCLNPRILVCSYPAVEGAIATLKGGTMGPYISMAFSEMEYLVTLSGIPHFMIMVWCWRTGIRLACKETGITSMSQKLSCSLNSPTLVCQLVEGESRLLLWELNACARQCCLTRQDIKLPQNCMPTGVCFTTEGALLMVDSNGGVFQVDLEEFEAICRVNVAKAQTNPGSTETEQRQQRVLSPCITFYKTGVLIAGPHNKLRFYKRSGNWAELWSLTLSTPICWLTYLTEADAVLGWTFLSELISVDCGKYPQVSLLKYYGNNFVDMELVFPDGNTIVTINTLDELLVWNKEDGHLMGTYNIRKAAEQCLRLTSRILCIKANPQYPYIGLAMTNGLLLFVSILHPSTPTTLAKFLLCGSEISSVSFAPAGDVLVAISASAGHLFLIQGVPGQDMQVVAHLVVDVPVVDCILMPDEQPLLAVLLASEKNCLVGNKIAIYTLESDGLHADVVSTMQHSYRRLVVNTRGKNLCFGAVQYSRQYHSLKVQRKVGVLLHESLPSGHQLRNVQVWEHVEYGLLTYGMDGIVIARPVGSKQQFYIVIPHHRTDLGVKKAVQDPKGEFIISLGHDNSVVCSKLKRTAKYTPGSTDPSPEMVEKFRNLTTGFFLEGEYTGLTWLEYKEKMVTAEEAQQASTEKSQIMEEFKALQKKVVEMLLENEEAPPEEHLPITAFDLDKDTRASAVEKGRLERERLRTHTLALVSVLDQKSALIKENCWDPAKVKPTSIQSLVRNYRVDNYTVLPESQATRDLLETVIERRKLEMKANEVDLFKPWVPTNYSELEMQLTTGSSFTPVDETARFKQALQALQEGRAVENVQDEEEEEEVGEDESPHVMSGSSVYLYIEPSPYHHSQFALNTYLQAAHSIVLLQKDITDLQVWFNRQFQVMYQAKEREMNTVKELHQRLRCIVSELFLTCSVVHPDPDPIDPEWTQYERPEMIITVEDKEVGVELYLSPSEKELLRKQAEEEERQRLLLLADNFRDIALIKMMDGVLEIRWEDELKKDVPKPKCMLEKDPEDFSEDDIRAVRDYEEKVAFLMSEREHYQKMLDSEYRRVKQSLKESVNKFEQRLLELFDLKLRVEAASTQHTLRILRSRLLNPNRMLLVEKENAVREMIASNQKALSEEQALVTQLLEATAECRAAYDAQLTRDKGLDAKFKREFPELSPMMVEIAFRLYRRRPKMQQHALVSATVMNELGRCAVAYKRPSYLPLECLEILKGIDALDNIANAPPNMNPDSWTNVCRLRRVRIESEMKIKALALQIAEAENTVSIFQRIVKALKENDKELQAQLRTVHDEQMLFESDVEVQIVMKQGLVEIPLTGSIVDFKNAILISRKDVTQINEIIKAAGQKKLRAMRAACNFRRGIIFKEWEHRKMRMHIEDREEELKTIESVKVTKEVQDWLRMKQMGKVEDRGVLSLDKEIARIRAGFEKYINVLSEIVGEYDRRTQAKIRANRKVDWSITQINVAVNELQFERDLEHEKAISDGRRERMEMLVQRAQLVRQVQLTHSEILSLESELQSLRLRTYPILKHS